MDDPNLVEQTTQMYSTSRWFSNTNSLYSALNGMYNVKQINLNLDKYQMIDDFQDSMLLRTKKLENGCNRFCFFPRVLVFLGFLSWYHVHNICYILAWTQHSCEFLEGTSGFYLGFHVGFHLRFHLRFH